MSILGWMMDALKFALLGLFIGGILFCISSLVFKFVLKKKMNLKKVILYVFSFCYALVLIGGTLLNRSSVYGSAEGVLPLFYSYKEAWNSFLISDWALLILNICLFIPFGILLPCINKRFKKWFPVVLVGFVLTLGIECVQYIFHLGIFELDDLFNNTLGVMIGYGIYAIIEAILHKEWNVKVWMKQIPCLVCIFGFISVFIAYSMQDLGNLSQNYIVRYDTDFLQVNSEIALEDEKTYQMVYQAETFSKNGADQFAKEYLNYLGDEMDSTRIYYYEESYWYYGLNENLLTINPTDKTFSLENHEVTFDQNNKKLDEVSEEKMIRILKDYNLNLPEGMDFTFEKEGNFTFTLEEYRDNQMLQMGSVSGVVYTNEKLGILNYDIKKANAYKEFEICSEREAYERLCEGKFLERGNRKQTLVLNVTSCNLEYVLDTKGYYQPVYIFHCDLENDDYGRDILIPAIL